MNPILIGLNTIASLLGYNRFVSYEFNQQDLLKIANYTSHEIINLDDELTLSDTTNSYDLYTIEGENRYKCIEFSNSYVIYDKKEEAIDEYTFSKSPYYQKEDMLCIYVEDSNYIKYGIVDDYSIYNLKQEKYLNNISSIALKDSNTEAGKYYYFNE